MATLPSRYDVTKVQPRPTMGVTEANTGLIMGQAVLGGAMRNVGDDMMREAAVEKEKLDRLKEEDALTQLMQAEIQMKQEDAAVKAGGVLDPNYHTTSSERYNAKIDELSAGLTDEQKASFQTNAKRRQTHYDAWRYGHATNETENYYTKVAADKQAMWGDQAAVAGANDPIGYQTAVDGAIADAARELARQGYTDPQDPHVKETLKAVYQNIAGQAIDHALVSNDTASATELFNRSKAVLNDKQLANLGPRLDTANAYVSGVAIADKASEMRAAGKSPIEIEKYIRHNAKGNAKVYDAAQTIYGNELQAETKAQAEQVGEVYIAYQKGGSNGRAMQRVLASPEFAKLPADQQAKVTEYMKDDVYQQTQRARADISWNQSQADRNRAQKEIQGFGKFMETLESPNFAQMTRAELFALAPEVGMSNVAKLVSSQKELVSGAAKFEISKEILDAATPPDLLDKSKKDKLYAYRGMVESNLMDWKAANPGKTPTPDEQRAIARSANAVWVEKKDFWFDKEHPAYEGPPEAWVKELQAAATKKGKTLSPAQVEQAWRKQSLQGQ